MIVTYGDLKKLLDNATEEQLKQTVQIMLPQTDGDKPIPLHPVIDFGTVEFFCSDENGKTCNYTRSADDNQHREEQLVLLADWNPYSEDGAIAFNLITGEPIYPKKKD